MNSPASEDSRIVPWSMLSMVQLVGAIHRAQSLHTRARFVEEFIAAVGPALSSFIARQMRPDVVEDVCQETQVTLATKIDACRGRTEREIWAWCYGVARNKIADHWRREGRHTTLSLDVDEVRRAVELSVNEEPAAPAERHDLDYALALVRAVKPPCVNLLWERLGLELSLDEIGVIYDLSADAARMQVKRCLELAQKLVSRAQPEANHE